MSAVRLLLGFALVLLLLAHPAYAASGDDDKDQDGIPDAKDNCPYDYNPDQADSDYDGLGDVCDNCPYDSGPASNNGCPEKEQVSDKDQDGIADSQDNCPYDYNPDQTDMDKDGVGDACDNCDDRDFDGDGVVNCNDQCPDEYGTKSNNGCPEAQLPPDVDKDGVTDSKDNCPDTYNPDQTDSDDDGLGDACDNCPNDYGSASNNGCPAEQPGPEETDSDNDGVSDTNDKCPKEVGPKDNSGCPIPPPVVVITQPVIPPLPNPPNMRINLTLFIDPFGLGNSSVGASADDPAGVRLITIFVDNITRRTCAGVRTCLARVPDLSNQSIVGVLVFNNNSQNGTNGTVPSSTRVDPSWLGDDDHDGILNNADNCRRVANADQADSDHDGVGDACDRCDPLHACDNGSGIMQTYMCGRMVPFQAGGDYYHEVLYAAMPSSGCGCSDSDGVNYFTRGSVLSEQVSTAPGVTYSGARRVVGCQVTSSCEAAGTDSCIDGSTLSEAYCGPDGPATMTVRCPEGCTNGACECTDSDNGMNYYVAGELNGEPDFCLNNYTLVEFGCGIHGGYQGTDNRTVRCPYGCENGACQCTDSDGGADFGTKGHIGTTNFTISTNRSREDRCLSDNRTLIEYTSRLANNTCNAIETRHLCDGRCVDGACLQPTCSDAIQNQGERDVDCGGPCPACGMVKINGTLVYLDSYGPGGSNHKAIRNVQVELYPTGRTTMTDSHGYFEFIIPRSPGTSYNIRFKADNWAAKVESDEVYFTNWQYSDGSNPLFRVGDTGQVDGGVLIAGEAPSGYYSSDDAMYHTIQARTVQFNGLMITSTAPYFNMIESVAMAHAWADGHRNDGDTITKATINYPASEDTPMYSTFWEQIYMPNSFDGSNPATIDEPVIHEFGHQLEDDISNIDWTGGSHTICTIKDEEFAWNEGFPEFYAGFIVNKYRNDPNYWLDARSGTFTSLETPSCTVLTSRVEGAVAAMLWDIVDSPGAYQGSVNESFDNMALGEAGADAIFKIFDREMDNFIDAPDACQFVWGDGGWKAWWRGRPEAAAIDPIMAQYGITQHFCDI